MADANVYVRYLADASKLVTESKRAGKSVRGVGEESKQADRSFGKFAGRAATFFAGSAALAGITSWAQAGIALADTADLVRVSWDKTFGAASGTITKNLEAQRKALGLAEFEMQQLLLTTGQLAQQQGLSKDESAAFAQELFAMAGDVAAFTGNLDAAPEVLGAFQAALRGEFDPLEQYGIKLSAAAIEQKALEMTGKATTKELTAQEKQAAILALITEALADETGALADAMANGATKANELTAEMKDAQEEVGQAGQIIKGTLNDALLKAINLLKDIGKWIADTMVWLDRFGTRNDNVLGKLALLLSDIMEAFFGVGDGAQRMAERLHRFLAPVRTLIDGIRSAASGLNSVVGGIGRVGTSLAGKVLGFDTGGVVPGPTGSAQLAVVHGGERIQTPQQQAFGAGGGGAQVINVTVNAGLANPYETATAVVDLLRLYQRTQGPLPGAVNS
jgi:hypothetical protein